MKSVDKLREWANGLHGVYINQIDHTITVTTGWDSPPDMDSVSLRDHVNGILDAIEREVADMVPLPVDADGVPIHVGDVVTAKLLFGGTSEPLVVDRMELSRGKDGHLWMIALDTDKSCFNLPGILRHHHAPTVEDVLREFANGLGVPVADSYVAAAAAKLRLAEDKLAEDNNCLYPWERDE